MSRKPCISVPLLRKVQQTILIRSIWVVLLAIMTATALAQSVPGVQMFSTNENGVDLATGNINIDSIILRNKPGKIPFWSDLSATSGMTTGCNGIVWCSMMSYPGIAARTAATGVTFSATLWGKGWVQCTSGTHTYWYGNMQGPILITDPTGAQHRMNSTTWTVSSAPAGAGCPVTTGSGGPYLAMDGSGYSWTLTNGNPTVYAKNGYFWPGTCTYYGGCVLSNLVNDPDGATISAAYNQSTGHWNEVDSLTTNVFTQMPNPGQSPLGNGPFSYLDAAGNTQTITLNYATVTVATNFNCINSNGVQEPEDYPSSHALLTSVVTPGGTYSFSYETTPGGYSGRLAQVTLPTGGTITYQYSGGNNGINCVYHTVPTLTVTRYDNLGNNSQYTYASSLSTAATSNNNSPLGNFTVTKTDPAGNQTVFNFAGEFQTQAMVYQGGCPTGTTGCTGGGTRLSTTLICYNGNTTNCATPSSVPLLPITQIDTYTTPGGMSTSNHVEKVFDCYNSPSQCYGNVIQTIVYDYGATTPTETIDTPIGSWNGSSCVAVGNNINDRLCYKNVWSGSDSGGTLLSSETFKYDPKGHVLNHVRATTSTGITGPTLTTSYTYNSNGTVATMQDVNYSDHSALYTYGYGGTGCNSMLPTSTTLTGTGLPSGGLGTGATYSDCNGAMATQTTDANSQPTTYTYNDPLWRVKSMTDALNNATNYNYTTTSFESVMNFNGTTSTSEALATTDGLGRPTVSQAQQSQGGQNYDSAQTVYGWGSSKGGCTNTPPFTTGLCTTQSVPYSAAVGAGAPTGTAVTTTQYDALGRPSLVTDAAGGTVSYSYVKNDVLIAIGPTQTFSRQLEYDGLGRLTSVCEVTSAIGSTTCGQTTSQTGFWTRYKYDAAGRLIGVCQNTTVSLTLDCVQSPSA